jgi:hypothetical protein
MIHPNTELRFVNKHIGYGVFATAKIPQGTVVYVKDALEADIEPDNPLFENPHYKELIEKYSYIDNRGHFVFSWDAARFVNHCCNSNTISTGYGFEIAIKDIEKGDEITDEYGILNLKNELKLKCSRANCRKAITPSDLDNHAGTWDEQIKAALAKFNAVEQPLLKFIDKSIYEDVMGYVNSGSGYISVANQKFNSEQRI